MESSARQLTIPSVYGGNILMWAGILCFPQIVIDEGEYFEKQTFRNRMEIAAERGVTSLIIPLRKGKNNRQPMKEVQISYAENWPSVHKKTIFSAYGKSAYFEHYEHDIHILYDTRDKWLVEWNYRFFEFFLKELIAAEKQISRSSAYIEPKDAGTDYRKFMTPKADPTMIHPPYYHIFFDKYPQPKNLSILDLLLNEGPSGYLILKNTSLPA